MRKVIVRYSGVGADAVRQNIVSLSGVNAALNVNVIPASIVDMEEGREQDVKQQLASLSGVTRIEEEQQLVPMVADRDYIEDFLGVAEKQRGYAVPLAGGDELPFFGSTQVTDSGELQDVDDCLDYIGVSALHEQGLDGSGAIVANVDQGVPESQIAEERRLDGFAADGSDPWEIIGGHGAYTMGIAAGGEQTDGISRGVAYGADVYPIKTTFSNTGLLVTADHIQSMAQRFDRPIVVNNSWGHTGCTGACDGAWTEAFLEAAKEPNVYMVFSAGNEAQRCGQSCSASNANGINAINSTDEVLAVAAAGRNGQPENLHPYSSRGPGSCGTEKPDITAPIFGNVPWGAGSRNIGNKGGTSGSCPQVAGVLALALSELGSTLPQPSVFNPFRETSRQFQGSGWNQCTGHGMIRSQSAVEQSASGGAFGIPTAIADATVAAAGIAGPFAYSRLRDEL